MSWLDELSELERRARARRAELEQEVARLRPLIAEHDELTQLLDRLDLQRAEDPTAAASPAASTVTAKPARQPTRKRAARKPTPRRSAGRKPSAAPKAAKPAARKPAPVSTTAKPAANAERGSRRRGDAARPGERERQLLGLVAARPGITVAEVAKELSVDPTGLYGIVRRLQGKGRLNKDGAGLTIISSATEAVAAASAPSAA